MTSWRCRLFGHDPAPAPVWNDGRHYTTCRRCGIDLVRGRSMVWRPAPPGTRIVWTGGEEAETLEPVLPLEDLPGPNRH